MIDANPSHYVTITTPHDQTDAADKAEKTARIKQLVGQLQNNLCNVSVMSDPDLDSLSNMDPNSLVDITGKDFMEQLKDSGSFKVKDITRNIKKAVVAGSLEEIRSKVAEKFEKIDQIPTIHLDSDGTEIDDEEYFRTLDANTELIAVFPGEHWIDVRKVFYVENRFKND
ncbi:DNA fragmentation factor subunit alpha-like [Lucilia cuprina]|uniref:DNA fragmentation factor subunit alpha-like n=1 Tax=Lucilia cuprina TaxID=7375 RepID=UPI001F069B21|nr:DNA fragmentation factor subunit alpha-like [Lucilia cuprina]